MRTDWTDDPDQFLLGFLHVNTAADWIDKKAVLKFNRMEDRKYHPLDFAIACTEFYAWKNFGEIYKMSSKEVQDTVRKLPVYNANLYIEYRQAS